MEEFEESLKREFIRVFTGKESESIEFHEGYSNINHCFLIINKKDNEEAQIWLTTRQLKMLHNSLNRAILKRVKD